MAQPRGSRAIATSASLPHAAITSHTHLPYSTLVLEGEVHACRAPLPAPLIKVALPFCFLPFRKLGGLHGHMRPCRCRHIEEGSIPHRDGRVQDDNPATRRLEMTTVHCMRNPRYDLIAPLGWKGR
jgi:hypothetical protein